jgi:hypothetical protein
MKANLRGDLNGRRGSGEHRNNEITQIGMSESSPNSCVGPQPPDKGGGYHDHPRHRRRPRRRPRHRGSGGSRLVERAPEGHPIPSLVAGTDGATTCMLVTSSPSPESSSLKWWPSRESALTRSRNETFAFSCERVYRARGGCHQVGNHPRHGGHPECLARIERVRQRAGPAKRKQRTATARSPKRNLRRLRDRGPPKFVILLTAFGGRRKANHFPLCLVSRVSKTLPHCGASGVVCGWSAVHKTTSRTPHPRERIRSHHDHPDPRRPRPGHRRSHRH